MRSPNKHTLSIRIYRLDSGMQPVFYSEKNKESDNVGWVRRGEDMMYYKNHRSRTFGSCRVQNWYTMSWTTTFHHDDDTAYFAHCYPYTYSMLQDYLLTLHSDKERSRNFHERVLCEV